MYSMYKLKTYDSQQLYAVDAKYKFVSFCVGTELVNLY